VGRLILLLGGNQGNVTDTFFNVYAGLEEYLGPIVKTSGLYESEPWGFESDDNFINQVVEVSCTLNAFDVLLHTRKIETDLGRSQKSGTCYTSRPIDIDILFFDDLELNSDELTIPHPRLHERMFTLMPLMEKWSTLIHPGNKRSVQQLFENCTDRSWVKKIDTPFD